MRRSFVTGPLLAAVWLAAVVCAATAASEPVTRAVMLRLADRTTVVLELGEPPARVEEIQADATSVVVEAGPFAGPIQPQELTPAGTSAFVSAVSIGHASHQDGTTYVSVRVTTHGGPAHHLRRSGARIYLDFFELVAPVVRLKPDTIVNTQKSAAPETKSPPPQADPEAAYRALETSVLGRARGMAGRPDVKGLLRLRDEVERRDKELGGRQPGAVNTLKIELLRYTDEARALQLERDRQAFLKKQ